MVSKNLLSFFYVVWEEVITDMHMVVSRVGKAFGVVALIFSNAGALFTHICHISSSDGIEADRSGFFVL